MLFFTRRRICRGAIIYRLRIFFPQMLFIFDIVEIVQRELFQSIIIEYGLVLSRKISSANHVCCVTNGAFAKNTKGKANEIFANNRSIRKPRRLVRRPHRFRREFNNDAVTTVAFAIGRDDWPWHYGFSRTSDDQVLDQPWLGQPCGWCGQCSCIGCDRKKWCCWRSSAENAHERGKFVWVFGRRGRRLRWRFFVYISMCDYELGNRLTCLQTIGMIVDVASFFRLDK